MKTNPTNIIKERITMDIADLVVALTTKVDALNTNVVALNEKIDNLHATTTTTVSAPEVDLKPVLDAIADVRAQLSPTMGAAGSAT